MEGKMFLKLVVMVVAISWVIVPTTFAATTGTEPVCLASISTTCTAAGDDPTDSNIQACCDALSSTINDDLTCFCLLQPYFEGNASDTANVNALFTRCEIDGTFDTLCPTNGSTTPASETSSDVPATPSSPSGTGIGKGIGGKTNAGNKMATTSLSGLVIAFISLLMMRAI